MTTTRACTALGRALRTFSIGLDIIAVVLGYRLKQDQERVALSFTETLVALLLGAVARLGRRPIHVALAYTVANGPHRYRRLCCRHVRHADRH